MRAPLYSKRQWQSLRLQSDPGAQGVEDIEIAPEKPAFLTYLMLIIFAVSSHLNPPLNNPGKVYVESISLTAEMRVSSSVLCRTMVASGPTEVLMPSFTGQPTGDHIARARATIKQPAANAPLLASNPVNQVFRVSPLAPFHHAGVEGFISHVGTGVGASLGPNAEVLHDSGTQRIEAPPGDTIVPISININVSSWHDMTANGIPLSGRNMYFLFCAEACPDGVVLERGILLSACYHEQ